MHWMSCTTCWSLLPSDGPAASKSASKRLASAVRFEHSQVANVGSLDTGQTTTDSMLYQRCRENAHRLLNVKGMASTWASAQIRGALYQDL